MTEKCKAMCSGCRDDFYNHRTNCDGKSECWSYESATVVVKKEVHLDQVPPWNQKARQFLSCYRAPRFVYVAPDRTC